MLTVRKVEPGDRELLDAAAQLDPFHRAAKLTGEHWEGALLYSDDLGPRLALQTTTAVRVDIQFITQNKLRNAKALLEAFTPYIKVLQKRGVKEVIFNSNSAAVITFFEKRFHFRHLGGNEYSLRIQ